MKHFLAIIIVILCMKSISAQDVQKINYDEIMTNFVKDANEDMLFGNGVSSAINHVKNDSDALVKGLRMSDSGNKNWKILKSKKVTIHNVEYNVILFELNKRHLNMALYKKENDNQYYFRTYNAYYKQ